MLVSALLVAMPLFVAAHGAGSSWEREVEGMRIDIGYDPRAFEVDKTAVFDFALVDPRSGTDVPVDEVWVRLARGESAVLAAGLVPPEAAKTTLLYAFDREGSYTLSASYRKGGETLAEATFPFSVEAHADAAPAASWLLYALGAALAGLIALYTYRKRRT